MFQWLRRAPRTPKVTIHPGSVLIHSAWTKTFGEDIILVHIDGNVKRPYLAAHNRMDGVQSIRIGVEEGDRRPTEVELNLDAGWRVIAETDKYAVWICAFRVGSTWTSIYER